MFKNLVLFDVAGPGYLIGAGLAFVALLAIVVFLIILAVKLIKKIIDTKETKENITDNEEE